MRRGFSLIEIVVVLALIAIAGTLVVVNAEGMLRGLGSEPNERIFQKAVREARFQAASLKENAFLSYDDESGMLSIFNEGGQLLAEFTISRDSSGKLTELVFEQLLPASGLDSFSNEEAVEIQQVVFRPDRSSTPFRVTLRDNQDNFTLRYDPFSAIVIHDSRNPQ